jgi:hypothetical protein
LNACNQKVPYESAEMIYTEGDQSNVLKWKNITFNEYHTIHIWAGEKLPNNIKDGKQIAIVNEDNNEKLFEIKGFLTDEWVIVYSDVLMSRVYIIYS